VLKLLKWAIYGMVGYVIYEFVSGVIEPGQIAHPRNGAGSRNSSRARRNSGQIMTGTQGEGKYVAVSDTSGAERRARVGRGVVS
jgi:hypothetical protein